MIKILVAAPASGSGKTAVSCALLAALKKRGYHPCACKCGPDYIDPMFHQAALDVESRNLDLFLAGERETAASFRSCCQGHDAVVCEGVMGYYDGLGGVTAQGSTYDLADTLELPVLLVVRPKGASLTLAAQIKGLCAFRSPHRIKGLLLNDCSPMLCGTLGPMLERETGLPVLGCLPPMAEAAFQSRHLGLYTAAEILDIRERIDHLAAQLEKSVDMKRLLELFSFPAEESIPFPREKKKTDGLRLAVAKDRAFCFCYAQTLENFEKAGIAPVFFSPLEDKELPAAEGLYLPGGYPELYARELAGNGLMRRAVQEAVLSGLPTVAECGGYLYLCEKLEDSEGLFWPMAAVLPGTGRNQKRLVRFGYAHLTAAEDSLLFQKGERAPIHEFHYWDTEPGGDAFSMEKPVTGRRWRGGFASPSLYAAFGHLYFDETRAGRLAEAMTRWKEEKGNGRA